MPVVVEKMDKPDPQDLTDLEKLYNDYPTELRFPELQQLMVSDSAITLYAARFNARILGALTVRKTPDGLKIDHLCVRKITRRRNVARDLLRSVISSTDHAAFYFESCMDDAAINALFASAGFEKQASLFRRTP